MILSATFDEQLLNTISIEEWLDFCVKHQLKSLEFSPDPSVLPMATYKRLMQKQRALSIGTTFHVPYFVKNIDPKGAAYDLAYFLSDPLLFKDRYNTLFNYIELAEQPTLLTIHGAKKQTKNDLNMHQKSKEATWFALDYLLNYRHKKDLPLTICIELSGPESPTYLTAKEELLETLDQFKDDALKICWDLTHDFSRHHTLELPEAPFVKAIEHIHLHGINQQNKKHLPLQDSLLDPHMAIALLKEINYKKRIVLELLMNTCGEKEHYLKYLSKDLMALLKEF